MLQNISSQWSGSVRREELDGKEYLVAPLSMIVPGVLNGSKGPLYYPLEEIQRNYAAWNGMPIVVNHPTDEHGNAVSARSPAIIKKFGIGSVFNARVDGKLVAEGWFNVDKTRKLSPSTYKKLLEGKSEELSTGLFTDNEPAAANSEYEGRSYTHIARNYQPDHLAVLPDKRGACSVEDGCGVNVNEETICLIAELEEDDIPWYKLVSNTESEAWFDLIDNASGDQYLDWDNLESNECATCGPQCSCESCKDKYQANMMPSDKSKVSPAKARKILKDGAVHGKPLTDDQRKFFGAIASQDQTKNVLGDLNMKLSDDKRKEIIDALITNEGVECDDCNPWTEEDRKALNALPDTKLAALNAQRVALAAKSEEKEEVQNVTQLPAEEVTPKKFSELSEAEFLAIAPPKIRASIQNAMAFDKARKDKLIGQITKNEKNTFTKEYLENRSLEELTALAQLADTRKDSNQVQNDSLYQFNFNGLPVNQFTRNLGEEFAREDLDMAADSEW